MGSKRKEMNKEDQNHLKKIRRYGAPKNQALKKKVYSSLLSQL